MRVFLLCCQRCSTSSKPLVTQKPCLNQLVEVGENLPTLCRKTLGRDSLLCRSFCALTPQPTSPPCSLAATNINNWLSTTAGSQVKAFQRPEIRNQKGFCSLHLSIRCLEDVRSSMLNCLRYHAPACLPGSVVKGFYALPQSVKDLDSLPLALLWGVRALQVQQHIVTTCQTCHF